MSDLETSPAVAAEAFPCGYEGCNGEGHSAWEPQERWCHQLPTATFDKGIVKVGFWIMDDTPEADIVFAGEGTMTSADLREAADEYEGFPTWLRAQADRLDLLGGEE
jgi:hypothetical protein